MGDEPRTSLETRLVLKKDNYQAWKKAIVPLLRFNELWSVIDSSANRSREDEADMDDEAQYLIFSCIDPSETDRLGDYKNAYEAWKLLAEN